MLINKTLGAFFIDFEKFTYAVTNQFKRNKAEAEDIVLNIISKVLGNLSDICSTVAIRQAFADWSDYPDANKELFPTIDRVHPHQGGFYKYAEKLTPVVKKMLRI